MPKGEYDTPGPFDRTRMLVRRTFAPASGLDVQPQLAFVETLDEAERDELTGLLNKGTHYVKLIELIRDMRACLEGPIGQSEAARAMHSDEMLRVIVEADKVLADAPE